MKARKNKSVLDYLDTPAKVRKLTGLFQKEDRKVAQAFINATSGAQVNRADALAAYYERLSNSIVALQTEESNKNRGASSRAGTPGIRKHVKVFEINTEASTDYVDSDLGPVSIFYRHFHKVVTGPFAGLMFLEPNTGGVTFLFPSGLPTTAHMYFSKNWSPSMGVASASPSSAILPQGVVTEANVWFDYEWRVVGPNNGISVCIKTTDTRMGAVSAGVKCVLVY